MRTLNLFTDEVVAAGASVESEILDLEAFAKEGYLSIQLALTDDGTVKVEYELSNTGAVYVTQSDADDIIVSGFTKTSGPGSDGKDVISFEPEPALKLKIKVTETGGVSGVVVDMTILVL